MRRPHEQPRLCLQRSVLGRGPGPGQLSTAGRGRVLLLRGLLFAAVEQAPRRWLPLRKSAWGTAQQGVAANLAQLRGLVWARTGSA